MPHEEGVPHTTQPFEYAITCFCGNLIGYTTDDSNGSFAIADREIEFACLRCARTTNKPPPEEKE